MPFFVSSSAISFTLIPLLVAMPVWAQSDLPAASAQPAGSLFVKVIDSDGAQVPANSRSAKGFSVLVTDAAGGPIADAAIALRLPDSGATGVFADGAHSAVAYSDSSGHARFDGIQWGPAAGVMAIRLTATKANEHAGLLLEQTLLNGAAAAPSSPALAVAAPRLDIAPAVPAPRPTLASAEPGELNSIPAHLDAAPVVRPVVNAAAAAPGISVITDSKVAPFLRSSSSPSISISRDGAGYHGSYRKWVYIGLGIAAAAGAYFAFTSLSKAASTSASSSSISFGTPTVSVGHP